MQQDIPGMDSTNAVSIYGPADGSDEFPVLKAFQQYIDAEQAKARKRMVSLAILFGVMMAGVVAVFVTLLFYISQRNQALNDRLVEFAMKERSQPAVQQQPVVTVQPQQSTEALVSVVSRLDALQRQLEASEQKAAKAAAEAQAKAVTPKPEPTTQPKGDQSPSRQAEEIATLKALLQVEKDKLAAEKEKARQAELEVYRRKHYPECYETAKQKKATVPSIRTRKKSRLRDLDELDDEADEELDDNDAIKYFDDDDEDDVKPIPRKKSTTKKSIEPEKNSPENVVKSVKPKASAPIQSEEQVKPQVKAKPQEQIKPQASTKPTEQKDVKLNLGGATSSWGIPVD